MIPWFSKLKKRIQECGPRVFLVDPDNLLGDCNFYADLARGYILHRYENDGNLFKLEAGQESKILIVSPTQLRRNHIEQNYEILRLTLGDVFEDMDPVILREVDPTYYQRIFDYSNELRKTGQLPSTKVIVYKSVWGIDLGELNSPTVNLRIALSYVINRKDLPEEILQAASRSLGRDIHCLRDDVEEKGVFVRNLIETYLDDIRHGKTPVYELSSPEIQIYLLKAAREMNISFLDIPGNLPEKDSWLLVLSCDKKEHSLRLRLDSQIKTFKDLLANLSKKPLNLNEDMDIFLDLSATFCELVYLLENNTIRPERDFDLAAAQRDMESLFRRFIQDHYEGIFYWEPTAEKPAVTVDKILDYIEKRWPRQKDSKICLLVMDGMSYDEWFVFKEQLESFHLEQHQVFAILPTITKYSRTSIFSGKTPHQVFADNRSIEEDKLYSLAMRQRGFNQNELLFGRINLQRNTIESLSETLPFDASLPFKRIGLICNLFDDICHQEVFVMPGKQGIYQNLKSKVASSKIIPLLMHLRNEGYIIILTSDHGNVYSEGNGIKPMKSLEEERLSLRCLVYNNEALADRTVREHPDSAFMYYHRWLPKDRFPVFALGTGSFHTKGAPLITHGGSSVEELIVPLVVIT